MTLGRCFALWLRRVTRGCSLFGMEPWRFIPCLRTTFSGSRTSSAQTTTGRGMLLQPWPPHRPPPLLPLPCSPPICPGSPAAPSRSSRIVCATAGSRSVGRRQTCRVGCERHWVTAYSINQRTRPPRQPLLVWSGSLTCPATRTFRRCAADVGRQAQGGKREGGREYHAVAVRAVLASPFDLLLIASAAVHHLAPPHCMLVTVSVAGR
jgi:hypothetical protein